VPAPHWYFKATSQLGTATIAKEILTNLS
jgi:hypothetical protein